MTITIKWGRDKISIGLPPPDTKLAALRRSLAEYTHLPEHSFKLVHSGAVMKDDNAPISAYNIHEHSIIALIGGSTNDHDQLPLPPPQNRSSSSTPKSESSTISQIHHELDTVRRTLISDIDTFLHTISHSKSYHPSNLNDRSPSPYPMQSNSVTAPVPTRTLEKEHTRLAELLLQALLRLDAITTEGAWENARRERKSAVREVQGLLDRLDGGWRESKLSLY